MIPPVKPGATDRVKRGITLPGMGTLGGRLLAARHARGLTQAELGELLGVSKAAISRWESDQDYPSFEFLPKLREHLQRTLDQLLLDAKTATHVADGQASYFGEMVNIARGRDEAALLAKFRRMSARRQRALLVLISTGDREP